jgi:uncharacterized protein (TIGR03067 family)
VQPEAMGGARLTIRGDQFETLAGDEREAGRLVLDDSVRPHTMDLVGQVGPRGGRTFRAIYALAGDSLRLCYDMSGGRRPVAFMSQAGSGLYLVHYKRLREDTPPASA